ncbi:MAG TPA: hypothetical protein VFZ86_05165 [Thermoleophilia bacterium]|nr:hypothetical protein [Thermoleophilia bacterium]
MSRKVVLIPILAVVVVAVAVITAAVWRQADAGPPIQTKALGVWQEQTTSQPIRLTVSAADAPADVARYWVTYAPTSAEPLPARLEGDRILVWGEGTQEVRWVITYDEGADALLLASPSGSERHILRRVST